MKRLVFDIETNGLNELTISKETPVPECTKVWCLCILDIDTEESWEFTTDMAEGVNMLRGADLIIGHNIIMFDVPILERMYGPIDTKTYDTLVVSRLMYPDRANHPFGSNSLKAWGEYLDNYKIEYDLGFEEYNEDMLKYCIQDVVLTRDIYNKQIDYRNQYPKSIQLEHLVSTIVSKQVQNGFGFNLEQADLLEQELLMEKTMLEDRLGDIFPPITEERWSEKTGKRLKDKVTYFNPGSRKQIAERLGTKYGWSAPKTDKGNPKVDSAVLKKLEFFEAKMLVRYFDIIKLHSQLSDWILRASHSRDGRIHGMVNTQGTVTGRMTASQPNLQQVSGDPRARELFIPTDGWLQVGIDASGLEARLLANRMAEWDDGQYGKDILSSDIHTVNQMAAGLSSRDQAKTFFYALIYGAGDGKIGQIVGKRAKEGKGIKDQFFKSMPALKKLIDSCEFQVAKKGTLTLLDGREVPCRAKHKALNVQIQGDGAIIMKLAQCLLNKKINELYQGKARFMATVHDEWQLECDPSIAKQIGILGTKAIAEAGERLCCKVQMDGEFRVGQNWSECH